MEYKSYIDVTASWNYIKAKIGFIEGM
jgi:hypothetical protein